MKLRSFALARALFVLMLSFAAVPARAAVLTVTTNEDTDDGVCNQQCSLREAIAAAQQTDMIIFDRSLRGATIQLTSPLVINNLDLTVDAPNNRRITLRGSGTDRVVEINGSGNTLDGFVITNGRYSGTGTNGIGGGGVYITAGVATLSNCIVTGNSAKGNGGGVAVASDGGVKSFINTTISNNTSDGNQGGAGIYVRTFYTQLRLSNTTVADNVAARATATGGIMMERYALLMFSSTVAGNTGGAVGGIYSPLVGSANSINFIFNSIIAGNSGAISDLDTPRHTIRRTLLGVDWYGDYPNGENGNIVGTPQTPVDALLAPLTDNGGNLPTRMLLANSPARDQIVRQPNEPATTDARGYERVVNHLMDMGAVEYGAARAATAVTVRGRVTLRGGRGVTGARIVLRDQAAGETLRQAQTNPFGYYQFLNVPIDREYRIEAQTKQLLQFAAQTFVAEEATEYADFAL